MRLLLLLIASIACAEEKPVAQLIPWLLDQGDSLEGIPFSEVIAATSGKRILPINKKDGETRRIVSAIGTALDGVLVKMNAAGSPAKSEKRVNEMSAHFENALRAALDATPGFACDVPKTTAGAKQRSGYPDLRLVDKATGRVLYLDPKLYAKGSRTSSLRTFYFTPKRETNKVNDDAHHIIVAFEHVKSDAGIAFAKWEMIDLSAFRVRLKAEFEGSNADMYRESAIIGRSK